MDGAGCCEVASEATSLDPRGELVKTEVRGGPSIERDLKGRPGRRSSSSRQPSSETESCIGLLHQGRRKQFESGVAKNRLYRLLKHSLKLRPEIHNRWGGEGVQI